MKYLDTGCGSKQGNGEGEPGLWPELFDSQGLAVEATKSNLRHWQHQRKLDKNVS